MKPNQYVAPHVDTVKWNINTIDDNNASIHFNTADVRAEALAATDPSVYVAALVEAAEDYLNGDEWREAAIEATPCEFRPAGAEATGQQIITMADRTVTFDPRKNWDNQTVEKGEVLAGSVIFTEPTDAALVISHRATILDHNIQAGFTRAPWLRPLTRCSMTSSTVPLGGRSLRSLDCSKYRGCLRASQPASL